MNPSFWEGRRVFLTGHTGFKGSWLGLWLSALGARVDGFALPPEPHDQLFRGLGTDHLGSSTFGDLRDPVAVRSALADARPELVLHLGAQALVRRSYAEPVETFATNVMGTVHLLEAARSCPGVRAVVVVTSDKCYEESEEPRPYREGDPMGGHDPYSSSKGCAELVCAAYRRSFFAARGGPEAIGLATARAGNVIGGGDRSPDRLVPDLVRAVLADTALTLRNPGATRPWQHVLDPLAGYLALAERLHADPARFGEGWNFGPDQADARTVGEVARRLSELFGRTAPPELDRDRGPREAPHLALDSGKAIRELSWRPRWPFERALRAVAEWEQAVAGGADPRRVSLEQLRAFQGEDDASAG